MVDDWKPDPRTIRLCIEALPKWVGHVNFDGTSCEIYRGSPHKVLEEMLPDPAEELVREWNASDDCEEYAHQRNIMLSLYDARIESEIAYTRWLINQGKVRP